MSWFKNLFNKSKSVIKTAEPKPSASAIITKWYPKHEDFITQNVDECLDLMLRERLLDVEHIVPYGARYGVFVAGGFASHLAGITQSHGDIDLFCVSKTVYDDISKLIYECNKQEPKFFAVDGRTHAGGSLGGLPFLEEKVSDHGGRVGKFVYRDQQYDLIDISHKFNHFTSLPSITDLLKLFDLNWTMAAIDLKKETITCHKESLLEKPLLNSAYLYNLYPTVLKRLTKYRSRLTRNVDEATADQLASYLEYRIKKVSKDYLEEFY